MHCFYPCKARILYLFEINFINMKKYKSYIFLFSLILLFLIVGYCALGPSSKNDSLQEKATVILKRVDALIDENNPPQFNKAMQIMDSCTQKDKKYYDVTEFKEKYDRLKILTEI